jgi:hypothetical protein
MVKPKQVTYRTKHDGEGIAIRAEERDGQYVLSHLLGKAGRTPEVTISREQYEAGGWHGQRVDAMRDRILAQDPDTAVEGFGRAQRLAEQYVFAVGRLRQQQGVQR